MSWTRAGRLYGFHQPYNFKVAIPFLLNACGLALVVISSAVLLFHGSLTVGTPRFYFVSYICAALLIAALISRFAVTTSYVLLIWCVVDVALGLVSHVLQKSGAGVSYLPHNTFAQQTDPIFVYHPLLQRVPKANLHRERFNIVIQHNSLGLRGVEPSEDDLKKDLIFIYGGSTTYDVWVTQGSTWVERLGAELHNRYTILNFGVPAYSTTENLIQTAFYQGIVNKRPVCAIYYEGWNDIHNAHIKGLDHAYADFHLLLTAMRSSDFYIAKYSPLAKLMNGAARRRFDSVPMQPAVNFWAGKPESGGDKNLEDIYAEHLDTIKAINGSRGIKTVLIGQILNKEYFEETPQLTDGIVLFGGLTYGWAPRIRNEDIWPLQVRFNEILRAQSTAGFPAKYIDPGIDNFEAADFVDQGHFSESGARKFASLVSPEIDSYCR